MVNGISESQKRLPANSALLKKVFRQYKAVHHSEQKKCSEFDFVPLIITRYTSSFQLGHVFALCDFLQHGAPNDACQIFLSESFQMRWKVLRQPSPISPKAFLDTDFPLPAIAWEEMAMEMKWCGLPRNAQFTAVGRKDSLHGNEAFTSQALRCFQQSALLVLYVHKTEMVLEEPRLLPGRFGVPSWRPTRNCKMSSFLVLFGAAPGVSKIRVGLQDMFSHLLIWGFSKNVALDQNFFF